jgi:hypothetical protein
MNDDDKKIYEAYLEIVNTGKVEEFTDEIIVEISDEHIRSHFPNIMESIWVPSFKSGWSYRIDPRNDGTVSKRHIHVSKTKHTSAPRKQASWNDDGTRHDKRNFNPSVGSKKIAQQIARDALNLSDETVLEYLTMDEGVLLLESNNPQGIVFSFSAK